jgi:hypothetical protein
VQANLAEWRLSWRRFPKLNLALRITMSASTSLVVLPPSDDLCGNDISYYDALLITGSLLCFDVIITIMVFVASSEHSDNEVVQAAAEGTK